MKRKSALLITLVIPSVCLLLGAIVYAGRVRASASQHLHSGHTAKAASGQATSIGLGSAGTAACTFSVTPTSQSFTAAGGAGSINVTTGTGCTWTAVAGYPWITITSGTTGTGSGTVSYSVDANTEVINQIGTILVAGQFVAISQSGAGKSCTATALTIPQTVNASLSAADCRSITDETAYGDLYSFSAQAGQRVAISLSSAQFDTWLTLVAPDGSIIAVNDDSNTNVSTDSRIPPGSDYFVLPIGGTYLIDASSYYSDAVGSYTLSLIAPVGQSCTYSIAPMLQSFSASGGNGSFNVTTSPGCGWTAGRDVSWVSFDAGESGVGSGSISYTVAPNTSLGFRGASLLIAGQVVSVVQAGTGGDCPITPLVLPQNVNGSWTPGGCTSPNGSLCDLYSFSGQAGQQVAISLTTTSNFTSIYLYLAHGFYLFSEGDGNLRLPLTNGIFVVLPLTGAYVVEVGAGGAGNYALSLSVPGETGGCTPVVGLNTNRLCNPGAELGDGGTTESQIVAIPGWETTSNFTVTRYGVPELPSLADSTRIGGGNNFFTGGPNNASSNATQTVSVSDETSGIDAGQRLAQLQAYLGGYPGDDDTATVRAEYLNAGGISIGTPLVIGPANGSLHMVTNSGSVPSGTRAIRVTLLAVRVHGSYNDAYFDNVSLTLSQSGGASCPTITNLSPTNGAVGTSVTITGTNLTGVTTVKFANNVTAQFTVNSATQISATVPSGAVTGPITLSKTSCQDVNSAIFTVSSAGGCATISFASRTNFPAGSDNYTVAVGDFNADGKLDAASANSGSDNVSVLLGNGTGGLGSATYYAVGDFPERILARDINGDAKLDLMASNFDSDNVSVLLGLGNGTFSQATNFASGNGPADIATGDFNGDGKLDMAVTNELAANVAILLGNGSGGFALPMTFSSGTSPFALATADFNSDGKLDLAVVNLGVSVLIHLGVGNGSFGAATPFGTTGYSFDIDVGDLNADNHPDLVVTNDTQSNVAVLLGNGTGGFAAATTFAVGLVPDTPLIADLNGDGKLDLAVTNHDSNNISVLQGNGSGGLAAAINYATGSGPVGLVSGDFNGDGKLDLIVANSHDDNVSILLNNCTGTITCPSVTNLSPSSGAVGSAVTITGTNFTGVTAVKFTSNVIATFSVVNATTITATVPAGAGSGPITLSKAGCSDTATGTFTVTTGTTGCSSPSFASAVNYATGTLPVGVAVKDFNGDGRPDMATSNYTSSNVAIFLANSMGGFNSATYLNAGSGPTAIESADFNGDSKFDLAVVNYTSNNVSILLGNGSGGFSAATNYAVGTTPRNIVLGDFNADGKVDLAVANRDSNNVSVLLGNGSGGFSTSATLSAGTQTLSVAAGDFNGDGKLDIAASNGTSSNVSVFLGNGNGTFGTAVNYSTGTFPFSVVAADLNADGKTDLATANYNSGNLAVLLGTGTGSFAAPVYYPLGSQPIFVTVSDLNLDGKPDLASAVYGGGVVGILLGSGTGTFGTPTNLTVGTNPNYVGIADLNGDSRPDLAVTNYQSASVSVLLNTCTAATCPTVSGINPSGGAVGSTVTITGTNFTGVTAVKFTSSVTASFTVNSSTQITATVPNGAVTGPITISKTGCSDVLTTAFTVTAPCIAVNISTGLTGPSGGTLTVPISVSDTAGRGAIAYDFTLTYDPAVLRPQTTAIDKTGTLSASMTVTPNSSVSGQLVVSAFGATALTGAGTLLNLKFDVIGGSSSCSNLNWVSFRFNEGTPCSTTTSGRACAVGGSIAGTVSYCITPRPVPNVIVSAAGTPSAMSTTGGAGTYQLTGLSGGPYTVTPAKTGDVNGIASFDAALIAQHAAMLTMLNSCQQVAADTSGEGGITSFDAALVAQHTVGIPNASSKVGTWKFVPPTRDYPTLTGDQTNQNYNAVLVGDVSGNWAAGAALVEEQPQRDPLLAQQDVQVALPELVAGAGTSLILPITVGDLTGRGVLAYDFDVIYNASLLQSQAQPVDASGTLSSNFTITPNATAGRLRVSGFGPVPLTGSGVLVKLRFNVIGAVGNNTTLSWQAFQFNEGSPAVATVPGRVTIINIYTLSLTPSSQTVPVGSSASLTLVSSVTQPVAVTFPVISSNSAVASVPPSVTIPANATMTTFNVIPNAVGGPVTITAGYASLPGAPLSTAMVTVVRRVTCVSAASFAGEGLASESIVAGFGASLATSTEVAATVPLPTQLAGTTVNVRDSLGVSRLAPLFFVSDGQVNFQIPAGTALGTATVTVTSGIGTVSSGAMAIVKVAPGLFTANSDGGGVPAAYIIRVKPDGQQIAQDVWMLNQQTARFVPREIDLTISGDRVFLILFGTGIRSYDSISTVVVRFGNEDQQVDAALAQGFFVGLDQVNVEMVRSRIPPGPVTATLRVEGVVARSVDLLVK